MLFLSICERERRTARREVERIRDADLQSSSSITAGSGPVTMPRAPPVGTALIGGTTARRWCGGAESASPERPCMPGVPRSTPLESVASPIQNGQSLFARPSRPPPDLLSFRIHRLTPTTPLLPPSQPQASSEEGHQRKQTCQVLDRLQPTRRRWHHGRGALCTRATPCIPPFLFAAAGGRSARVAFGGVALLGRAACAAAIWSLVCGAQAALVAALLVSGGPALQAAAAAIARPSFAKEAVWPLLPRLAARWLALRLSALLRASPVLPSP